MTAMLEVRDTWNRTAQNSTSPRFVTPSEVEAALGLEDLIEPVSRAFQAYSCGRAHNEMISLHPLRDRTAGDVLVKAATLEGSTVFVVKVAPWFAANVADGKPQGGLVAAFNALTGHTIALIDDQHRISDLRTAAAGALAARVLAPASVESAAVLGSGTQAYWQAMALHCERPFDRLYIWARDERKARRLGERISQRLPHLTIQYVGAETAVRQSDVIITATGAREPIVRGDWLHEGQHITAIGADDATKCELDATTLQRSTVLVDEIALATETGDVHAAIARGQYRADLIAGELGEVLAGRKMGRQSESEITVATLSGLGVQDIAAVEVLLRKMGEKT